MTWQLANPTAAATIEAFKKFNQPVPDSLHPPPLRKGLHEWLDAFWELHTERQLGMSIGPIPHSKIVAASENYPDGDDFITTMHALDETYRNFLSDDNKGRTAAEARNARR